MRRISRRFPSTVCQQSDVSVASVAVVDSHSVSAFVSLDALSLPTFFFLLLVCYVLC